MKRIAALICTVIICFCNSACSYHDYYPSASENFSEEFCDNFFENYTPCANLAYRNASPFEVAIRMEDDRYCLALLPDTDKSQFLAMVWEEKPSMGASASVPYLVKGNNAPDPMSDWTVESVSIFVTENSFPGRYRGEHQSWMTDFLQENNSTRVLGSWQGEENSIVKNVQNTYRAVLSAENDTPSDLVSIHGKTDVGRQYYLVVTFRENQNIVWISGLLEKDGLLYLGTPRSALWDENDFHFDDWGYGAFDDETSAAFKTAIASDRVITFS